MQLCVENNKMTTSTFFKVIKIFLTLHISSCSLFPLKECSSVNLDILLVFDCRYYKEVQLSFMHHLLQHFISTQETSSRFSIATFNTAGTQVIVPMKELNSSNQIFSLKLTQSDCFNTISVPEIFEFSRVGFGDSRRNVTRLAVILFNPNISQHITDAEISHQIVNTTDREGGIQRFFVISAPDIKMYANSNSIYYTKSLVELNKDKGAVISICSNCRKDMVSFTGSAWGHSTCYFIGNDTSRQTFDQASESCHKLKWASNILIINSSEEYLFVISELAEKMSHLKLSEVNIYLGFSETMSRNVAEIHKTVVPVISFKMDSNGGHICKGCYSLNIVLYSKARPIEESNVLQILDKQFIFNLNNISKLTELNVVQICEIEMAVPTTKNIQTKSSLGIQTILSSAFIYLHNERLLREVSTNANRIESNICNESMRSEDVNVCANFLNCNSELGHDAVCNNEICDGAIMYFTKHPLLPAWFTYIDTKYEGPQLETRYLNNTKSNAVDSSKDTYVLKEVRKENMNEYNSPPLNVSDTHLDTATVGLDMNVTSVSCTVKFPSYSVSQVVTVPKCIYTRVYDSVDLECIENLKNCETFECPKMYFKCPDSYCIPLKFVDDGKKECPNGEEEGGTCNTNFKETSNDCKANIKSVYKDLCVSHELDEDYLNVTNGMLSVLSTLKKQFPLPENSEFLCQTLCPQNYTCLSSTIKEKKSDDTFIYRVYSSRFNYIMFDDMGTLRLCPGYESELYFKNVIELSFPNCFILHRKFEFNGREYASLLSVDLSRNEIDGSGVFAAIILMKSLRFLNLSYNENLKLTEGLSFPALLINLDLSHTGIDILTLDNFKHVKYLKYLNLSYTRLRSIRLPVNFKIEVLDLCGTHLKDVGPNYFNGLTIEVAMFADDYKLCCPQITGSNLSQSLCHTPRDVISSCNDLISDVLKRIILWTVGVLALKGNLLVLIYRLIWDRAIIAKSYGAFVTSLAAADLVMGLYLIVVASADVYYRDVYVLNDSFWRYSQACQIAGFLATFSNETSTFFICLITLDRYLVMKYPLGEYRISQPGKIWSVILAWFMGLILALIPALLPSWEIYSTNGLCLGLPLSTRRQSGWQYAVTLTIGLNTVLFLCIAFGQVAIFRSFFENKMKSSSMSKTSSLARDVTIAKKLALVALSDFLCWFPVGVMGIISLAGYELSLDSYAWSAILVLPINSALNPVIYTVPAIMQKF